MHRRPAPAQIHKLMQCDQEDVNPALQGGCFAIAHFLVQEAALGSASCEGEGEGEGEGQGES